jgi:hypothetical protein
VDLMSLEPSVLSCQLASPAIGMVSIGAGRHSERTIVIRYSIS